MEILLLFLKMIGIILLLLLSLIVLAVLTVLFVPIRYKIYAGYYKEPDINACVSWIMHILSVRLKINQADKSCVIRIFGIPIMDLFNPKPKKRKSVKRKKKTKTKKNPKIKDKHDESGTNEYKKTEQKQIQYGQADNSVETNQESPSILDRVLKYLKGVVKFIKSVPDTIRTTKEKGIDAKKKAENWVMVFKRDRTQKAIEYAKDLIFWFFKRILPKKWHGYIHFGFKDPAVTAQILGYYWMFFGLLTDRLTCQPEFEKEILEGELQLSGYIQFFTLLVIGWKVMFDPSLKYLRNIKAEVDSL